MNRSNRLLELAKRIQAIAENGQHYALSDFDLDRYRDLEGIANELISLLAGKPVPAIEMAIREKVGYRTPKVDVRAVVFNEKDEILMVKEQIDGKWSLPGGWADVGYTPAEVAVKETFEEAGITVQPVKILGVFDKKCHDHPPDLYYVYKIFIECRMLNDRINPGYETSAAAFYPMGNLPELSGPRNTRKQIELMFSFRKDEIPWPFLDLN